MFIKSIRWRLLLWLGFVLLVLLGGFALTSFQLNRIHRFRQIDEELEARVAAVSTDRRGALPLPPPVIGRPPPGVRGPDQPPAGTEPGWFGPEAPARNPGQP